MEITFNFSIINQVIIVNARVDDVMFNFFFLVKWQIANEALWQN